MNILLSVMLA